MNIKLNKILTAFLIVLMTFTTLTGCSGDSSGNTDKSNKDYSNIEMNPNISIPGFESLEFKAGTKKQSVSFYNPEENTCYFRISLMLKANEGTGTDNESGENEGKETEESVGTSAPEKSTGADEAEEALWTSDLIEPGEEVKSIKLDKELESGDYPAYLKYECFSLKDETPLNGSNVELTLSVR